MKDFLDEVFFVFFSHYTIFILFILYFVMDSYFAAKNDNSYGFSWEKKLKFTTREALDAKERFYNYIKISLREKKLEEAISILFISAGYLLEVGAKEKPSSGSMIKKIINQEFRDISKDFLNRVTESIRIQSETLDVYSANRLLIKILETFFNLTSSLHEEDRESFNDFLFIFLYVVTYSSNEKRSEKEEIINRLIFHFQIGTGKNSYFRKTAEAKLNKEKNKKHDPLVNSLEILSLEKNFTRKDLEVAWKKTALRYHPDKHHSANPDIYDSMKEKFQEARNAYEFLLKKFN